MARSGMPFTAVPTSFTGVTGSGRCNQYALVKGIPMNICMVTTDYLPNIGGVAAHVFNLSRALTELGHTISVVNPVSDTDESIKQSFEHGFTVYRVGVNPNRWQYRNKIIRKMLLSNAALRGIKQAQKDNGKLDILHQHDYQDTTYAAAKFATDIPWVWTNHTARFLRDCHRRLKTKFIARVYSRTAGIITASKERETQSRLVFPSKPVTYIPNGVDTSVFTPRRESKRAAYGLDENDLVVLCPSRMTEKKGVIYLAQAVEEVSQSTPDISWKFVFLGSSSSVNTNAEYISEIKAILSPFENSGAVRYLGNIPLEQMPEINRLADIIMMPSLMEAVSLSALEGMATGCAMIVSNIGGLPEIVIHEETGLLVPPQDARAISQALIRLAKEPNLRKKLAENAQELAQTQYDWKQIAARTVNFYQSVSPLALS